MSAVIILCFCGMLLLAYAFDISSSLTRIPAVILLLVLGIGCRLLSEYLAVPLPDFEPLLPILGTIGLILIVLEGALELEINKSKIPVIRNAFIASFIPLLILVLAWAGLWSGLFQVSFKDAMENAIPFAVISSAIAIPSVRNLDQHKREFVIYESSFSDILGILLFNFISLNALIDVSVAASFLLQLLIILPASFIAVLALSFLLSRLKHHVTFTPIVLLVILLYAISKIVHLPGLVFILVFGLFLGNLDELKHVKWMKPFHSEKLDKEVKKFKEINIEATFLIRSLFFILFGFLIDLNSLFQSSTLPWALGLVLSILLVRGLILKFLKFSLHPLLYIAPRGLITILLYLSIHPERKMEWVNNSLIIQTILLSVVIMMIGLMGSHPNTASKTSTT
jgi:potassium/hydrogen antiporter